MIMKSEKQNLKGFRTLWIQFNRKNTDKHQLFLKEHSIRNQLPEHPKGRTLFVLNVPPYVTPKALQKAFSQICGNVTNVFFVTSKGFKTAYVVFEKETTLEKALELPANYMISLNRKNNVCLTGLAKWCKEYNESICDEEKLKKEIEDYMLDYDKKMAEKKANEKAMEEEAEDNDGWVTVSARKKRGEYALSRKESTINKVQHKEEQRNKKKQLLNFYTFQIRESKKQNLAELRKKFELDKQRLQSLKSKRTFRPF
ncbi:ribosomal RNA-processing protein 7 homolog A [Osmia bicornis bicornis]|uniref:ribosomal RNA-processing protein 7 homolog A n=1 Tax=Osmia bicornis bicornis TaxID=1437191 RepID=UPI001EAF738A|nr:ribosomal RNA-processing protein 7 homolog A [Osmia bicornis bicornis]